MLLVTGGHTGSGGWGGRDLASTEVYRPSAGEWREVPSGALPRPMDGVRLVTLNNRVLLFGEKIILFDDIVLITCTNKVEIATTTKKTITITQTSWSTQMMGRSGPELGKCQRKEVITPFPL